MKFGTSGLRGLVSDMTDDLVTSYTRAFLSCLASEGSGTSTLLVGRDLRPSSPRIAETCMKTAEAAGVGAVACGVLPTPALALEAERRGCPAIMVTGSHIPFDYNGLKFYRASGEITKADEASINRALGDAFADAAAPAARLRVEDETARQLYVARALTLLPARALEGRRIGLFEHSAAGRELMARILSGLGAFVVPFGRTDGFIPIDTEAVRPEDETLARAQAAAHGLDAVVSTDGDGDRPLMADETGTILRGDTLGILTARFLGADAVATPLSSNSALERTGWFPRIIRTRIGSPYVIEAMERLKAEGARLPVGYEPNGGFLLGGPAVVPSGAVLPALTTRDAVLPILATLGLAVREGQALSQLVHDLPRRSTASDRLKDISADRSGPFLSRLGSDVGARAAFLRPLGLSSVAEPDLRDGVRLSLAGDEILHLRASGNAPELRCYAEAADAERARLLVAIALDAVAAELPLR
jgi:phosphomannomutase